jgi:hypothetical protein
VIAKKGWKLGFAITLLDFDLFDVYNLFWISPYISVLPEL